MTSVCAANDPSVNHLFVIDSSMSPAASHTFNTATDSDDDSVSGIGRGSPILYILYASGSGHCHSNAEHEQIFLAAADALLCSVPQQTCQFPGQIGAGGVILRAADMSKAVVWLSLTSEPVAPVQIIVQQRACHSSQSVFAGSPSEQPNQAARQTRRANGTTSSSSSSYSSTTFGSF